MVAYSFKRQFVEPIRSRAKAQTMRNERKRHARAGETLQLYTGMRTKACMLIGTATCASVLPITLDFRHQRIAVDGVFVAERTPFVSEWSHKIKLDAFAVDDGFNDWKELYAFWAREHAAIVVWSGVLIRWIDFKPPEIASR